VTLPADFVHLHVHSEYSLLDGAAQLDKLVAKAKALGFKAIALTDHGNLFGGIDFYQAAKKAEVTPILGCELYVAPGGRKERGNQDGGYEGANHLTVLVRNQTGYKNLIRLVSKAYLEGFYYKPRVDKELLAQHADGLVVLSGCLNSEVSRLISGGETAKARQSAGWYQEVFGKDHYFMEVQAHGLAEQIKVTAETRRIAQAIGAPIAGTNDSHYLEAGHSRAHEALLCIQTGSTLNDPNRWKFSTEEFYVKSAEEMAVVFAEMPEACANTLRVAEQCDLKLDFGTFHLPKYTVPETHTLNSYLEELARQGLRRRYGPSPGDAIEERFRHELAVIEKMGFAGYFLVVWDFIHYARQHGIAVGPGRGSSAGSLVAYCLEITNIDPIRYHLLFERFLNPERISMPDMDIDFADDRRDEVIKYVAERYGHDHVAHIITFGTMGAKAVIRDVGRVLGLPFADVDRIAKLVPGFPLNITLDDAYQKSPPLAEMVKSQPAVKELWDIARALEGGTRHASVHASAVVISDEPLDEYVPLYKDPKRPELITGYAMGPIEKLGLLKMDFLGLRTLTVLANTAKLLKESRGIEIDVDALPLDDAKTYASLAEAKTLGVFQLESSGMREALRGLRPERLEDVIAMVSLYRPGPMDLIPDFINRKHGRAKITYEHPAMQKITQETYGIMIYQEQIMQIAVEMAGFTMGEADTLRRAMGKKDRELMAKQKEKFLAGCAERKTGAAKAEKVWELMEKFAGYGFNKCLTGDARVEMADGTTKPIVDVRDGDMVLTKDGPARTSGVRPSGVRRIVRLRLANGLSIACTPDHPVFTQRGWVNVEALDVDTDVVGIARALPRGSERVPSHRPALLGYALSRRTLGPAGEVALSSRSGAEIEDMRAIVECFENTVARVDDDAAARGSAVHPLPRDAAVPAEAIDFLVRECGLGGPNASEKRMPSMVDRWDRDALAILAAKLFQADGCIHVKSRAVSYATTSGELATDVRRLLLKLGILSTIHQQDCASCGGKRRSYTVTIADDADARGRFRALVGPHLAPSKAAALAELAAVEGTPGRKPGPGGGDFIPSQLFLDELRRAILKRFSTLREGLQALELGVTALSGKRRREGMRRDRLAGIARHLDDPGLQALADSPLAWSRPGAVEILGEEPTYDIEVPGPASFVANGIVVHNSHAAAYALVAYETAYFKANYPVEFMAALLTSEMGDTDKIVKYIEECRAMGVEVKPPDVNGSSVQFSVHADTIRFGLAALKNVGEAAMESILKTRAADGSFTTLEDFCARVDLRLVNRRVVESLIKAGAFDSVGVARAQLLATLDAAMESGQRQQRDKAEGQASFFDMLPAAAPPPVRAVDAASVPEWDDDQRLAFEKEVLGFYVSGHPLARFRPLVESLGITSSSELAARPGGSRVLLFGQVASLREIPTKSGNRMAFATIEDTDGTVDVTIFPEPFKAGAALLRSRDALLIRGKVDDTEKGRVVLAEEVRLLEHALGGGPSRGSNGGGGAPNACRVRIPGDGDIGAMLSGVRRVCGEHAGGVPLFVHVLVPSLEVVVRAAAVSVDGSAELAAKIDALLGAGACTVEHAGRA